MTDAIARAERLRRWLDSEDWQQCQADVQAEIFQQFLDGSRADVWQARADWDAWQRIVSWIEQRIGDGSIELAEQAQRRKR